MITTLCALEHLSLFRRSLKFGAMFGGMGSVSRLDQSYTGQRGISDIHAVALLFCVASLSVISTVIPAAGQEYLNQGALAFNQEESDRSWALSALAPGSTWRPQNVVDRLGEPEASISSDFGSQLFWIYRFPRSGVVVRVRDRDNRILTVTIRD